MAPRAPSEFVTEATEIVEALARDLYALDQARGQEPDPDLLNAIFRAAHSLKGLSAMFGLDRISQLAHRAEDVLDALRLGKVPASDDLRDALVETLDVLQALLMDASGSEVPDAGLRADTMGERLASLLASGGTHGPDLLDEAGVDASVRAVLTEYEEHRLRENVKKGVSLWKVRAVYSLEDFDQALAALGAALKPLGEVVSTLPSSQPGDESSIAFDLVFGSLKPLEAIVEAAGPKVTVAPLGHAPARPSSPPKPPPPVPSPAAYSAPRRVVPTSPGAVKPSRALPSSPDAGPRKVMPSSPDAPLRAAPPSSPDVMHLPVQAPPPPRPEPSLRSLTQTVRVDIGRLDVLMNSIGELLLVRGNIQRLADVASQAGVMPLPKLWGQELAREVRALERRLDELQKGVLDVRMVPLGQVFDKLARLMRRLVRESGKEVEFEVFGGDVELDKLIVEELSDPLMHLLRNALDHGVESPGQRTSRGKPPVATIRLRAKQQGNHVVIEVGDDGAGMDEVRIRQVAVQRGLVTEEQTEELDRRELLNLVFLPGFSTKRDVSELSGRGVGLDVVKTNLARLSGLIDIDSRRGHGTTFVLTLPLTLAIIRALMVQVSGRVYAVPLNSVTEIVTVESRDLRTIERREVLEVRGQTLPFVRLSRVFGLPESAPARHYVVIVGLAQQRMGIAVDALLGQQDIVTKPLGGRLANVNGIAGATELGDRRAVLVLDVASLMEELLRPQAAVN